MTDAVAHLDGRPKLTLAWRVGLPCVESDEAFDELISTLNSNRAVVDEVAIFDSATHHQYTPLDVYAHRLTMIERRLETFRRNGIRSAGINVLCTLGHVNEAWSYHEPLPYQPMVGVDGSVSRSCACPSSSKLRDYLRAKYQIAARAKPDFIWVDDDIRLHHHGVTWGCFCDQCLEIFARRSRRRLTRAALRKAFNQPEESKLRRCWIEHNRAGLESLLKCVRSAIRSHAPAMVTGLMTTGPGWTTYSGQDLQRWCRALGASKARPGGGFYNDAAPREMIRKGLEVGRQVVALPQTVKDVQYELENFPYQFLKKSTVGLIDECTLGLAFGVNGVAFNLLGIGQADYQPYVPAIAAARPMWERLIAHSHDLPVTGFWPAWSRDMMARSSVEKGQSWLGFSQAHDIQPPTVLAEIGLPLAPGLTDSTPVIFSGATIEAFTNAQLRDIFRGGVLMDGHALSILARKGLASLAGVTIEHRLNNGVVERFTPDALNTVHAKSVRDVRIEYWGETLGNADVLKPLSPAVRIISRQETLDGADQGPAMTAWENRLGGRVVVMGHSPWSFVHSIAKRHQLQEVCDWISRGRTPVRIEQPIPLVPVVRLSSDRRRGAVVLINAGLDRVPVATIHLRVKAEHACVLSLHEPPRDLELRARGEERVLTLFDLLPWSPHVILLGESHE